MFTAIGRTVLASALFLTLAVSAWAAEEKQGPPAKAEKMGEMEKKPEMGMMTTGRKDHREVQEALNAKGNDPGPTTYLRNCLLLQSFPFSPWPRIFRGENYALQTY